MQKIKNVTPHAKYDTACTTWQLLKGISIKNIYVPELSYPTLKKYINLKGLPNKNFRACGVIDTACTIFAFKNRSYLGEFEAELKKGFSP
jgi:hypothetical protein